MHLAGTVISYTCDWARTGCSFTWTPEEENRLCRFASEEDIENDNSNDIDQDRQLKLDRGWMKPSDPLISLPQQVWQRLLRHAVELRDLSCKQIPLPQFWSAALRKGLHTKCTLYRLTCRQVCIAPRYSQIPRCTGQDRSWSWTRSSHWAQRSGKSSRTL